VAILHERGKITGKYGILVMTRNKKNWNSGQCSLGEQITVEMEDGKTTEE
jgi:hypothetical protein